MGWGFVVFLAVLFLAVGTAVFQSQQKIGHQSRRGYWRIPPPGVMPLEQGTASSHWMALRAAKNYSTDGKICRSYNYNPATGAYQLFEDWLVNWTIRSQAGASKYENGTLTPIKNALITGMIENEFANVPFECVLKTRAEMFIYGMDPDGKISKLRDLADGSGTKIPYKDQAIQEAASGNNSEGANWQDAVNAKTFDQTDPPGSEDIGAPDDPTRGVDNAINSLLQASPFAFTGVDADGKLIQAAPELECTGGGCEDCSWCSSFSGESGLCSAKQTSWCNGALSQTMIRDKYKPSDVAYDLDDMCALHAPPAADGVDQSADPATVAAEAAAEAAAAAARAAATEGL